MAFADPQSVTINAVAQTLARVSNGTPGVFPKDDGNVKLSVGSTYSKDRARRIARLDHRKLAADPFTSGHNNFYTMSTYIVVDTPKDTGYTIAEAKQVVDALVAYLAASTGARVTQLLGGEN